MEKDVFFCHASVDKDWVEDLATDIEREEWNGRRLSVFLDKWDIDGGDNIVLRLNQGLERSRFVAVVMSPEMMVAEWCKAEWSSVAHVDPTNRSSTPTPATRSRRASLASCAASARATHEPHAFPGVR